MTEWLTIAFKILGKIPGVSGFVAPALERHRFRKVAVDLAALTFWKGETISSLQKIASGRGDQNDLHVLSDMLAQSQRKVDNALKRLRAARNTVVSTELGMEIAHSLDETIELKIGPGKIRPTIKHLIESGQPDKATAEDILVQIEV